MKFLNRQRSLQGPGGGTRAAAVLHAFVRALRRAGERGDAGRLDGRPRKWEGVPGDTRQTLSGVTWSGPCPKGFGGQHQGRRVGHQPIDNTTYEPKRGPGGLWGV